jgi:hypothetical protein
MDMPIDVPATWRRIRGPAGRFVAETLPVLPFALILASALGFTVWVGAELANAYPSDAAPMGWKGAASFDAGVATMRPQLVLAATIPGLLWGLSSVRRFKIGLTGPLRSGALLLTDLVLLASASWLGAVIAREGAAKTSNEAFWAFTGTHGLLAASFYSLAVLSAVVLRTAPALIAGALWTGYAAVYDNFLRWKALREMGLAGLRAGALPGWFYLAQAASPIALYRALLIVWHKGFRDYEERAVLEGVTLPPWMTVDIIGSLIAFAWVLLPLEAAWIVWSLRYNHDRKAIPLRNSAFAPRRPVMGRLLPTRAASASGASSPSAHRVRTAFAGVVSLVTGKDQAASDPKKVDVAPATTEAPKPPTT